MIEQYPENDTAMVQTAESLAARHWAYIGDLLTIHGIPSERIVENEFHYHSAFVHGYKHGVASVACAKYDPSAHIGSVAAPDQLEMIADKIDECVKTIDASNDLQMLNSTTIGYLLKISKRFRQWAIAERSF